MGRIRQIRWMRKLLNLDSFSVLAIILVGLLFFRKALFLSGAFVAGDIGLSDFSDFLLPSRFFLARTLKNFQ